jgi:hypothetical protein
MIDNPRSCSLCRPVYMIDDSGSGKMASLTRSEILKDDEFSKGLELSSVIECCQKCLIVNCLECNHEGLKCVRCTDGYEPSGKRTDCVVKTDYVIGNFTS